MKTNNIEWSGKILSIQPRIRLMRSFDERSHSYQGYVLRIDGICGNQKSGFLIAVGKVAQAKHRFRAGMEASGLAIPVSDPCLRRGRGRQARLETAGFYKVSGLKVLKDAGNESSPGPPFHGVSPDLETYRSRAGIEATMPEYDRRTGVKQLAGSGFESCAILCGVKGSSGKYYQGHCGHKSTDQAQ